VHLADKSPISWKADYRSEILNSLEQIGEIARKVSATAILDGGDFFHVKSAARTSHALITQVATLHSNYPCPVYAIEGNHDIVYSDLDSVERQPIGVLFSTKVFRQLRDKTFTNGDVSVRVVGLPYDTSSNLTERFREIKRGKETYLVVVAHALASYEPSSGIDELFGEPVASYDDLIYPGGPDVACFGHWHKDQGVVKIQNCTFVNQGSISRGSLTQENVDRMPQVAVIRFGKRVEVRLVSLHVADPDIVFDFAKREKKEMERDAIEQFVNRLKITASDDASVSVEDCIASLDFARDVRDAAVEYLERARA